MSLKLEGKKFSEYAKDLSEISDVSGAKIVGVKGNSAGSVNYSKINLKKGGLYNVAGVAPYDNLNTFPANEFWVSLNTTTANKIANVPDFVSNGEFSIFTLGASAESLKIQFIETYKKNVYARSSWDGSTWSDWTLFVGLDSISSVSSFDGSEKILSLKDGKQVSIPLYLFTETFQEEISKGGISEIMAASAPYNDLNTLPTNKFYVCTSSNACSLISNKPVDENFSVYTLSGKEVSSKIQFFTSASKNVYVRCTWGASWSSWLKIEKGIEENDLYTNRNFLARRKTIVNNSDSSSAPYNDVNTFPANEIAYCGTSYANISNRPCEEGFSVISLTTVGNYAIVQIAVSLSNNKYIRSKSPTSGWSSWVQIGKEIEVEPFYNPLEVFSNIVCIGDSLTYSQVYTSSSSSRQARKPYPTILGNICHCQTEIMAHAGDTALSNWNRYKDSVSSKENALAVIFLGTNYGLTDTLSTDAPEGSDSSTWADTNTGAYAKWCDKLKNLGYKILLIKPFATGGGGANLDVTKNVVGQISERFGCSVVESFRTTEAKYHYYPDGSGKNDLHYNDFGYSWFAYNLVDRVGKLPNDNLKRIIPN